MLHLLGVPKRVLWGPPNAANAAVPTRARTPSARDSLFLALVHPSVHGTGPAPPSGWSRGYERGPRARSGGCGPHARSGWSRATKAAVSL